jgi:hypothetical protein
MQWNPSGIGLVGIGYGMLFSAQTLHGPNEKETSSHREHERPLLPLHNS